MATWTPAELNLREWLARVDRRGCTVDASTTNRIRDLLHACGSQPSDQAALGAADPARLIPQVRAYLKQAKERIKANAPAYTLSKIDLAYMMETQAGQGRPAITCDGHSIYKHSYWVGKVPKPLLSSIETLFNWHENNEPLDKDGIFYGLHTLELYEYIADILAPQVFPDFNWRQKGKTLTGRGSRARRIHQQLTALLDPSTEWPHAEHASEEHASGEAVGKEEGEKRKTPEKEKKKKKRKAVDEAY